MNRSLDDFAAELRSPAGRPVVDKTGIQGKYDFVLSYAREGDKESPDPSFFTALQERYGLKLQKSKVRLDILVVDQVEKVPSDN